MIPLIGADTGCVVMVEEALDETAVDSFHAALQAQPPWSDLPLLLIAAQDSSLWSLVQTLFPSSGNVTVLQRPIHPVSLVSAVNERDPKSPPRRDRLQIISMTLQHGEDLIVGRRLREILSKARKTARRSPTMQPASSRGRSSAG